MKVFIDSGAWIAVAKTNDINHKRAASFLASLIDKHTALVTSNYVLVEAVTRILYDLGPSKALEFRLTVMEAQEKHLLSVQWVDREGENEAYELMAKYGEHRISLCDCTSLVIARRLGICTVFTFDRDFLIMGLDIQPGQGR